MPSLASTTTHLWRTLHLLPTLQHPLPNHSTAQKTLYLLWAPAPARAYLFHPHLDPSLTSHRFYIPYCNVLLFGWDFPSSLPFLSSVKAFFIPHSTEPRFVEPMTLFHLVKNTSLLGPT